MDHIAELSELENELGQLLLTEQECAGVYYLVAQRDDEAIATEYYAVTDTPIISQEAREYGKKHSIFWLFSKAEDAGGWRIIDYELGRYRVQNHLNQACSLHEIALNAAEFHPEYFGTYPVPFSSPRGYTTRYWILENGIYWVETDQCEEFLTVCYPVWSTELSSLAMQVGEQLEHDKTHGIHQTLGYIFFSSSVSCIPIHELMQTRTKWDRAVIDKRALMNVIWRRMPEYAVLANRWEQTGQNSILSVILPQLEFEQERVIQNDHMITMFPDAGEDYQLFKKAGAAAQSTQNPSTE